MPITRQRAGPLPRIVIPQNNETKIYRALQYYNRTHANANFVHEGMQWWSRQVAGFQEMEEYADLPIVRDSVNLLRQGNLGEVLGIWQQLSDVEDAQILVELRGFGFGDQAFDEEEGILWNDWLNEV